MAAEAAKFQADATAKLQALLGNEAWSRFADVTNADAIFVASNDSGADDPATATVRDTYFNSTFGYLGVDRLLAIDTPGKMRLLDLLPRFTPDYDVVILLVNSTKFGGSGGFPTICSLNTAADEIVLHELGHSFAGLADEYVDAAAAATSFPREYPNATQLATPALIPWRAFIQPSTSIPTASAPDENTVGLFPGSLYRPTGFYRPTNNSKMLALGRPFGPVNLRAFATAIHLLNLNYATTAPVITQQPAGGPVPAGQAFTLAVAAAGAGPLTYQWRFNASYLVNAIGPILSVAGMDATRAGAYSVEVTNAIGTVTSADAAVELAVPTPPSNVRVQPTAIALTVGSSVTFTATVDGTLPVTYQWQKNGVAMAGANGATLTLNNLTAPDWGTYTVLVANALGACLSNQATLTVMVPISPPSNAKTKINVP